MCIYTGLCVVFIGFVEFGDLVILTGKSLDYPVAGNVLLGISIHPGQFFSQQGMFGSYSLSEFEYDHKYEGRNYQDRQSQLPVHDQEIDGCCGEERKRLDYRPDYPGNIVTYGIQVSGNARHQIARAVGAVELHILSLDLVIQIITDLEKRRLGNILERHTGQVNNDNPEERESDHHSYEEIEIMRICTEGIAFVIQRKEQIHELARKERNNKLEDVINNCSDQGCNKQTPFSCHIFPQPGET